MIPRALNLAPKFQFAESRNVGALIMTNTILGVPYYKYSIMGPQNPILIITLCPDPAPRLHSGLGRGVG